MLVNKAVAKDRLILALDVNTKEEALKLVNELKEYVSFFKVGQQLFSSVGPDIFKAIKDAGCKVYFDSKYHDIPYLAAKASAAVARHGVDILNIHIVGGVDMMKKVKSEVKKAADKDGFKAPVILGVTVLSSIDQNKLIKEAFQNYVLDDLVCRLSEVAKECALEGVVASVRETALIKKHCGNDFIVLSSAIRPTWADPDDQVRIATPKEAIEQGTDFLVVGRPITKASDKIGATKKILEEMQQAIDA